MYSGGQTRGKNPKVLWSATIGADATEHQASLDAVSAIMVAGVQASMQVSIHVNE
jgi:hypothetical protein